MAPSQPKRAVKRDDMNAAYVIKRNPRIIPRIFLLRNMSP